jgi:hypothetical protein
MSELINENKLLFFPFSGTNVGEPIPCADGNEYEISDGDDNEDGEEESEAGFTFGELDCVGYLARVNDGILVMNSALETTTMGWTDVYVFDDCGVFEKPMVDFLKKFMK